MEREYWTLTTPTEEVLFKERHSKFVGRAFPITEDNGVRDVIKAVQAAHPKANHLCFAWRTGLNSPECGYSDDGEPTGTAGPPIKGQIEKNDLTEVVVTVVRYFGGVKLGKGGLIRAYRAAAAATLLTAQRRRLEPYFTWEFLVDYNQLSLLQRVAGEYNLNINAEFSTLPIRVFLQGRLSDQSSVSQRLEDLGIRQTPAPS